MREIYLNKSNKHMCMCHTEFICNKKIEKIAIPVEIISIDGTTGSVIVAFHIAVFFPFL